MRTKSLAVLAAALLLVASVAPAVAAEGDLAVAVEQDADGGAAVTVTHNGTAVENASVVVETADGNVTYAGEGNYTTDANGTVELPAPDESLNVTVTATTDEGTASTTAVLEAPSLDITVEQAEDASATATITYAITDEPADGATVNVTTVDENASYAGTGSYTADANGSVPLPAPDEPVEVTIAAEAGGMQDEEVVTLQNASTVREQEDLPFGAQVSAFVHNLLAGFDEDGNLGQAVSEWVRENNPGNAPEHAGPPDDGHRGQSASPAGGDGGNASATGAGGSHAQGPPEDRGPDHAGGSNGNGQATGRNK